jgi:hypothetical protein
MVPIYYKHFALDTIFLCGTTRFMLSDDGGRELLFPDQKMGFFI